MAKDLGKAAVAAAPTPTEPALPPIDFGARPVGSGRERANPAFVLAFHPKRWTVLEDQIIPCLRTITLRGGCDGVRLARGGRFDVSGLRDNLEGNGWTILPPSLRYCVETAPGSGSFRPSWGTVRSDGTIREDQAAYVTWLRGLMADGTLPPPDEDDVAHLRDRLTQYAEAVSTSRGPNWTTHETQLRGMVAAIGGAQ